MPKADAHARAHLGARLIHEWMAPAAHFGELRTGFHSISLTKRGAGRYSCVRRMPHPLLHTEQLAAIVEGADDGLLLLDAAGIVLHVNRAGERLGGLVRDAIVGRCLGDVSGGVVDWGVAMEAHRRQSAVATVQVVDGGRQLLVSARPAPPAYVVVTLRDVSEASRLMARLQQATETSRRYRSEARAGVAGAEARPLVARSPAMRAARELALRYAAVDLPVLILGETGTGKGVFADLIHRASDRAHGPFLEVNCGAIPEGLMESELFGYARGAFTGADARGKAGLVELADGGTLLLDEIGELPPGLQAKLLRFLENGEIRPVGGTRGRRPDVRIIAATNRDLPEMIGRGAFRADLFYRLNVLAIRLPPLREHPEDIAELVATMLVRLERRLRRRLSITAAALERLSAYAFPGNVRELSNVIDRLGVTARGETIDVGDLPADIGGASTGRAASQPLRDAVQRVEAAMLRDAVERFGTQELAARHLGVGQATVARKLKRYGLRAALPGPRSGAVE